MTKRPKFRAKNKTGQWVYGYFSYDILLDKYLILEEPTKKKIVWWTIDVKTLGHWIDVDDFDNDIYDHDIVEVIGDKYEYKFVASIRRYYQIMTEMQFPVDAKFKVIGNYIDNKEMIK